MGPKYRLSSELVRLSPITKYSPAGTVKGWLRLKGWGTGLGEVIGTGRGSQGSSRGLPSM